MSARYRLGHGIVIRRQALPSGDVVATLLSEHGKWRGIARKGRLPGGNLGRLSLFHDVTVQYYRKREDDLALLTQVRLNGALPRLSEPAVYPLAHLLAELADALTVDVHLGEPLYNFLASGLRGLNSHADPEAVGLLYGWRLLGQAGLAPHVRACGTCSEKRVEFLDITAGMTLCRSCGAGLELGERAGAELQALVTGDMRAALKLPLADRALHWRALARYITYHVHDLRSLRGFLATGDGRLRA